MFDLLVGTSKSLENVIVNAFVNNQTSSSCTTLTRCAYGSEEYRWNGEIEIGIVENDDGIVSTEFENCFSESRLNFERNLSANVGRTRERNQWNSWIFCQRLTDIISGTDQRG